MFKLKKIVRFNVTFREEIISLDFRSNLIDKVSVSCKRYKAYYLLTFARSESIIWKFKRTKLSVIPKHWNPLATSVKVQTIRK